MIQFTFDEKSHAGIWPLDKIPLYIDFTEKLKRVVYAANKHYFIEIEATEEAYKREGYDMQHCLQYLHKEYSQAARNKEIIVYSMIDLAGDPKVDIELALTKGCGVPIEVKHPTVMQIRGFRNQCPPADELLPDLMSFLTIYGRDWVVKHDYPNFDGKCDGRKVMEYCRKYKYGLAR
jgi:hypothetical protein